MKLSVLVVSYETRELLGRCLASLEAARQAESLEVVVVDNASRDGSAEMVRERFPAVRLLVFAENRGFSAGVNAAAREASGDVFLLLNPDAELPAGASTAMLGALEARPEASAIGFRQVDPEDHFQLAHGPDPKLASELLRSLVQRRLDRGDRRLARWLDRRHRTAKSVGWVSGSSLLVRRADFERVGGFDEGFFLYFEDVDFCLRLRAAGGRVFYDPSVTVMHHRGASAARSPALAAREYRRSQLRFWRKHRGPWAAGIVRRWLKLRGLLPRGL